MAIILTTNVLINSQAVVTRLFIVLRAIVHLQLVYLEKHNCVKRMMFTFTTTLLNYNSVTLLALLFLMKYQMVRSVVILKTPSKL